MYFLLCLRSRDRILSADTMKLIQLSALKSVPLSFLFSNILLCSELASEHVICRKPNVRLNRMKERKAVFAEERLLAKTDKRENGERE